MKTIYLTMHGLGDCIYTTPIVRQIVLRDGKINLSTPWPELYDLLPERDKITFYECKTTLRTQLKNIKKHIDLPPLPTNEFLHKLEYPRLVRCGHTIPNALMQSGCIKFNYELDLNFPKNEKDYAIIRPATIRTEWTNTARNCKQEYIQYAIDYLKSKNIKTIMIADIEDEKEYFADFKPKTDIEYINGQLSTKAILKIFANAKIAISPIGFAIPLCMAVKTKCIAIFGGQGFFNNPELLGTKPSSYIYNIIPEEFCMCRDNRHSCTKTINVNHIKNAIDLALGESYG